MSYKHNFALLLLFLLLAPVAAGGEAENPKEVLLYGFESATGKWKAAWESLDKLEYVTEHTTQGKKSGKFKLSKPLDLNLAFWGGANMGGKWQQFDRFLIDVYIKGGPAKVFGWVKDKAGGDWYKRYNFEFMLAPGKREVAFSLGGFVRQGGQNPLDLKALEFFAIRFQSLNAEQPATIYVDNARLVKGTGSFEVKMLYSFEGNDKGKRLLEDWPPKFKGKSAMAIVEEHATDGKKALRLDSQAPAGNVQFFDFDPDWSRYDTLAIDIFNMADKPVKVAGWIRPVSKTAGYYERHGYERVLKPGFNSMKLSLGGLTGPGGGLLDLSRIVSFNIAVDRQTLIIDNVRLVKGVEEVEVKGIRKFDFGPTKSACMPGFTRISSPDTYSKTRGWGWLPGARLGRDFDIMQMLGRHRPPDDLCRDFCQPTKATFAVDLPNGEYSVWLMLGPPGNGWGRHFRHRTVSAEGKLVVDERYDSESLKKHEFQFEDAEDLPGDDLWEKYINVLFRPKVFDVKVEDGQLNLAFDSGGAWWCSMVNGLVAFPKSEKLQGEKWLAELALRRKNQFDSLHVENLPPLPPVPDPHKGLSENDKARGYIRFTHSPDSEIQVNSVPTPEETGVKDLTLFASPGEYENSCFGIYPLKDCGKMKAVVTELIGPAGATIPAEQVKVLVLRYKALNQAAVYTITPKYLDPIQTEGVQVGPGVTRSFWLVVHVPENAKAGIYKGAVDLKFADGKSDRVGLSLTVWPIELVEPDFPVGMFMTGPFVGYTDMDETGESYWKEWKDILEDSRAHGMTSLDPGGVGLHIRKIIDGKADIDFSKMDRFMEMAKAAGFKQELLAYAFSPGFKIKIGGSMDMGKIARQHGCKNYAELVKAWASVVREHARLKNWLPICWCTDDEYLVHGGSPEKLAELHRILQENAPGFRFVPVDSLYLEANPKAAPEREKMLADIDTFGAGVHSPRLSQVMKKIRRRLWLYNTGMDRFTFGTYMFFARKKHAVKGFFQWVYPMVGTYTPHYLASHIEAHYGVVYPSTRGMRTTPIWERLRAGCDDHRYLETAWKLIAKAKTTGKAKAETESLQSTIEKVVSQLSFGKPRADAFAGTGRAENPMTPEGMEMFRRAVATGIIRLEQALR